MSLGEKRHHLNLLPLLDELDFRKSGRALTLKACSCITIRTHHLGVQSNETCVAVPTRRKSCPFVEIKRNTRSLQKTEHINKQL